MNPITSRPPNTPAANWESTRVQTQVAGSTEDGEARDIGRAVGNGMRELFVSCDPAEALVQQFDFLQPSFVAVHDLGTAGVARQLLTGIAAAAQRSVQQLVIRRSGVGTPLATLQFVDCPAANGSTVRLYATEIDADTASRHAMAQVLFSRSRLGIVMVGNLPGHVIQTHLEPWHRAVLQRGWTCRRILFLPLQSNPALATQVAAFRTATAIEASVTPPVSRPADVWQQLAVAWNDLQRRSQPGVDASRLPLLTSSQKPATPATPATPAVPAAAPAPVAPIPMPTIGAAAPADHSPLARYLGAVAHLQGVVSACAFEPGSGRPLGHAGARPSAEDLARHGTTIVGALANASRAMGLGAAPPDCLVTLGQHHLLLRALPALTGLPVGAMLHLVIDKLHAPPIDTLRDQLRKLDAGPAAR
ncbi:hypothetical protein [Caldimonas sp. KR1-144]|uniref:hypothetical protein n=1 Tax=Caldimonas sp. KR1-144 TaxID=3400911 RepID=UPI003C072B16